MTTLRSLALLAGFWSSTAFAVSTPFTYQGSLEVSGQPANGTFDFQFQLKSSGGGNLGSAIVIEDVPVTGGVFTVQLDFGSTYFTGPDRRLGISVRPGDAVDAFVPLLPDTPLTATPFALYANDAQTAIIASDVTDNAIDEIDINTGAVSTRNIATNAVAAAEIATDAVGASEIATDAVGSAEIAVDAVGADELAANSVAVSNLIGANYTSPANLNVTVSAHDCALFNIGVAGGFQVGDSLILNTLTALPDNVTVTALQVVSADVVRMSFCNVGTTSATVTNLQVRIISLR